MAIDCCCCSLTVRRAKYSLHNLFRSSELMSCSTGLVPYEASSRRCFDFLINRRFLYLRSTFLALSKVSFLFLLLQPVLSVSPTEWKSVFQTCAIQFGPHWTLRAAAMHLWWKDPDCARLKYLPPSILQRMDIKFSQMLVVLLEINWEALATSLSPNVSTALKSPAGKLSINSKIDSNYPCLCL